jgi:acetyl esterase/lipase
MPFRAVSILLLLLVACAAGRPLAVVPQVVTAAPVRNPPIAFPGGVQGYQAITYAQWPGFRPLTLDLYLPPSDPAGRRFPLVVYVHGGAWLGGDPRRAGAIEDFPALLASLARRGYAVASVSYRLSGEARFPAAPSDLRAALHWLGSTQDFPIDASRTLLWGSSAGAQVAALAATACDPCVRGVVAWYGVFDMRNMPGAADPEAPHWRMLGCVAAACGPLLDEASPAARVGPRAPPMLLIAGTADRIVPSDQSTAMAARLRAAGIRHELLLIEGVDHSFIGATPSDTRNATIRAVEATFRFIAEVLAPIQA